MDDPDLGEVLDHADDWWRSSAERALAWLAADGQPFDAWDVTQQLGVPDPDSPARWGALFSVALSRGEIEAVGYRRSRRPGRHNGVCRVWRGVEQEKRAA